ncbi:MAG: magnesium transporter [Treponema sp.]|nr:magnesium transporter [Treponema sp.]
MIRETIEGCLERKDMGTLKALLAGAEDMELLEAFVALSSERQAVVFRLLLKDAALRLFEQLDTDLQRALLQSFTDERVREFVNEMPPDDRVKLLDELPAVVAKKLLESLSPEERKVTAILMGYEAETAGRIMTTEYISLEREMTAARALEKIRRQARDKETIYTLFVTDGENRLEGVLSLQRLILADSDAQVADVMAKSPVRVSTDDDQEKVARTLQDLNLLAIPVVDREERLVGIVTIDDAVDILEDEATEDIFNQAGLADVDRSEADRSAILITGSLWKIWKVRLPFLFITLAAGLLAGAVVGGFEEALKSVAAVAIFIPLIMDMGGNVGTQSAIVFVRGMVLGHVSHRRFFRHLLKEIGIGFSMGLVIGLISGTIAAIWQGLPMLGVAVGVALTISMTMTAMFGFLIPFILIKLKGDEAAGSGPMITSINDIAGLFIYFVCVTIFMRGSM